LLIEVATFLLAIRGATFRKVMACEGRGQTDD